MSDTAEEFRDTIMDFKAKILKSLDDLTKDKHNDKWLDKAIDRIFQLGNIVTILIDNKYDPLNYDKETNASIQSVKDTFSSKEIDLGSLDYSTKRECKQVIEYDIYWYPYSLSQTHIESLVQNRVK